MVLTQQRRNELNAMWQTIEECMTNEKAMRRNGYEVWTSEMIEEERTKWFAYDEWKEKKRQEAVDERIRQLAKEAGKLETIIITVSIDQKLDTKKAIEKQYQIIEDLQGKYAWLIDAHAVFEYYTKDKGSKEIKWNPHVHIYVEQGKTRHSTIAQILQRKYQVRAELKYPQHVYRINAKKGKGNFQLDYIHGLKQDYKKELCEKDKKFREENEISEIFEIVGKNN